MDSGAQIPLLAFPKHTLDFQHLYHCQASPQMGSIKATALLFLQQGKTKEAKITTLCSSENLSEFYQKYLGIKNILTKHLVEGRAFG